MRHTCDNCDRTVSASYFRLFSVGDTLYGCQQCMPRSDVRAQAIAHADRRAPTTPDR